MAGDVFSGHRSGPADEGEEGASGRRLSTPNSVLRPGDRARALAQSDGLTDEAPRPAENAVHEEEERPRPATPVARSQTEGVGSATQRVGSSSTGDCPRG